MKGSKLTLQLQAEPDNEHDPNAILVLGRFTEGPNTYKAKLGYVPRGLAAEIAEENLPLLPRLRLIELRGDWINIKFDVLVSENGRPAIKYLPGLDGQTQDAQPESLPDDPEVRAIVDSMQLRPLPMAELLAISQRLLRQLSEGEIRKLAEIENFDAEEMHELEGEDLDDFRSDYEGWLLKLGNRDDFEEIQMSAVEVICVIEDVELAARRFCDRESSYELFAYELIKCIDSVEFELIGKDERPATSDAALKSVLAHLNQVTASISGDDENWRKLLDEMNQREAPLRLAALRDLIRVVEASELKMTFPDG